MPGTCLLHVAVERYIVQYAIAQRRGCAALCPNGSLFYCPGVLLAIMMAFPTGSLSTGQGTRYDNVTSFAGNLVLSGFIPGSFSRPPSIFIAG